AEVTSPSKDKKTPPQGVKTTLSIGKGTLKGKVAGRATTIHVRDFAGAVLCLVTEGVGVEVEGKQVGKLACGCACEALLRETRNGITGDAGPDRASDVLARAMTVANDEILTLIAKDRDLRHSGATAVALLWCGGPKVFLANVGTCRAYLVRDQKIQQLTVD